VHLSSTLVDMSRYICLVHCSSAYLVQFSRAYLVHFANVRDMCPKILPEICLFSAHCTHTDRWKGCFFQSDHEKYVYTYNVFTKAKIMNYTW